MPLEELIECIIISYLVLVNRPPTTAQRTTYNAGRPRSVPKSSHRTKKVKSNKSESHLVNPVWRPFGKSLSQVRHEIHSGKKTYIQTKSGSNLRQDQDCGISDKTPRWAIIKYLWK